MKTAFLDESGNLSFNFDVANTPRFFVISVVVCDGVKFLDRLIRRVYLSIKKSVRERRKGRVSGAPKACSFNRG